MMKRITLYEFIKRAKEIHENKYNYSLIKHLYSADKVSIICPIHGKFDQKVSLHLKGNGCPKCGILSRTDKRRKNTNDFIEESKEVHGNKYQYDKVDYVNSSTKVAITCPEHGDFLQTPNAHITQKQGCPTCGGSQKMTTEIFILKAREVHNNKFNYDKLIYKNSKTKVTITCPVHGDFSQTPNTHLSGNGCPKCGGTGKSNTKDFIEKAQIKHGQKHLYNKVKYINNSTKVIITCPEHGDFYQSPMKHLQGQGCRECAGNKKHTKETFIKKAREIHGDKFGYDHVIYSNNRTKVVITCPIHGNLEQTPRDHLSGYGCAICGNNIALTTESFIKKARERHGNQYNYDEVEYLNRKSKIKIICSFHGEFLQAPSNHLNGQGCPKCRLSKGEQKIQVTLDELGVKHESEYTFPDCFYNKSLPFDFAIFIEGKIGLIEYNGEHHYKSVNYGNKQTSLSKRQKLDGIKMDYANKHEYPILVIAYTDYENIEELIKGFVDKTRTANKV